MIAYCPTHGDQEFARCEPCSWWCCPGYDATCQSVIPEERVTPDGGDVVQWPGIGRCHEVTP